MADFINDLAGKAGVSPEAARKGMGSLLTALKGGLSADNFAQVQNAVPDADGMMAEAEAAPEKSGGALEAIKSLAGKMFGGSSGGPAALMGKLSASGISPQQIPQFLGKVLDFLQGKLPQPIMDKIRSLIPGGEAAS